jgi:TetR/AcrR family transcriptional regulator, cholesterol catabolism regulator
MEIKEKILTYSRSLFLKYGIRSVTMDMIADQMGISKRTIYENYANKDELLEECISGAQKQQTQMIAELFEGSVNIIEATLQFIKMQVNAINSINPVFLIELKKYYSDLWHRIHQNNETDSISWITSLIRKGVDEELFRNDINIEIVARLINEQFKVLGNQELFPGEKFSKAEIFENIAINFLRGIATDKGLAMIKDYKH